MVFSIRYQYQSLSTALCSSKSILCYTYCFRDYRTLSSSRIDRNGIQQHVYTSVVTSKWRLQIGPAGKEHQPYSIFRQFIQQRFDEQFGSTHPVRTHVFCHHTFAHIQSKNNIGASGLFNTTVFTAL